MKTTQILSLSVLLTVAAAQSFQSLPECGKLCVNNMLAKAKDLGCAQGDAACLCRNEDFAYGIRDCSFDVCGPQQSALVVSYRESYCKNAASGGAGSSSAIPGPVLSPSSSILPASTLTSMTGHGTPIATSALVSLVTHGTEVSTSTFSLTTIYSSEPTSTPSQSQSNNISSSTTSSIESSPSSSETASPSSSSEGSGAKPTAFAGLAAVAGLAALIL
ncbi:GPI-anchored CFEM domain protein [Erysiphe neolycopersici]|uniref:GPI-anchored CFEM domain protein n=1 Tax=Erysiphe neolycopersici TaxID=212602 RepID=A0A420HGE6_9PEZI|nr:GPI-anchored CFEM domain protein [Erysiphe neolycopersici]